MPKSTAAEFERRVSQVYMLLLQGEPRAKIVHFSTQNWGIKAEQAKKYIARARKQMLADLRLDREELRGQAISQRNDLYRKAYKQDRFSTCLQILDSRDRILGLFNDIDTHIEIVEAAGYEVRDPSIEAEDVDPAGELFADLESIPEDEAQGTSPSAENGLVPEDTEAISPSE